MILLCLMSLQIPVMARALGKRVFKRHLELFLDVIFDGVVSYIAAITLQAFNIAFFNCERDRLEHVLTEPDSLIYAFSILSHTCKQLRRYMYHVRRLLQKCDCRWKNHTTDRGRASEAWWEKKLCLVTWQCLPCLAEMVALYLHHVHIPELEPCQLSKGISP